MKILVDADVLIALAKEDDTNHKKAVKVASDLRKAALYITPFAIPEAVTVLSCKVSQLVAKKFLQEVRRRKLIELELNSRVIHQADQIFFEQNKKRTSWIDCLNIAMSKVYKLDGIFSFDRFYKMQGVKSFG